MVADENNIVDPEAKAVAATNAEPAAKKAVAKKPAAAKPAAKKPAAAKPAAKAKAEAVAKPAVKKPAAKKPTTKKPAAVKAVAAESKKAPVTAAEEKAVKAPKTVKAPKSAKPAKAVKAVKAEGERVAVGVPGKATVFDASGVIVDSLALNEALFGVEPVINTLHLAVRAEQAKRRRGTASSKTRGQVSGSTAKLYRQKGTGRARVGSRKSPTRVGGGVAFGPHPRTFNMKINRKVMRLALAMALSNRAASGGIFVARGLEDEMPNTAKLNRMLVTVDVAAPILVITDGEPVVTMSVRNLFYAETIELGLLSTEKVLRAKSLVLTEKAFVALNEA